MAVTNLARNLRDGELVIRDGGGQSLTVLLDQGDLSWEEHTNTIEVKDRGSIAEGHTRPGDDEAVSLSFSAKWTQLIGKTANAADALQLYEMLTFQPSLALQSTSADGEQKTLEFAFSVIDPTGAASERITFEKVYRESLTMSEGEDANVIAFAGKSFETAPTVARIS